MSKRRYPSLIGDCLSYKFRGPRSTWSTLWSNFVASAALGVRYDCSHVASAAFSASNLHLRPFQITPALRRANPLVGSAAHFAQKNSHRATTRNHVTIQNGHCATTPAHFVHKICTAPQWETTLRFKMATTPQRQPTLFTKFAPRHNGRPHYDPKLSPRHTRTLNHNVLLAQRE